jgi:hypothetical protein
MSAEFPGKDTQEVRSDSKRLVVGQFLALPV